MIQRPSILATLAIAALLAASTPASAAEYQYYVPLTVKHAGKNFEVYMPQTFKAHDGLGGKALVDAALAEMAKIYTDSKAFDVKVKGSSATMTVKDATKTVDPAIVDRAAGSVYHTLRAAGVSKVKLMKRPVTDSYFSRGAALIVLPFTSVMPPNRLAYGLIRYGAFVAPAQDFYKRLGEGDIEIRKAALDLLNNGSPAIKMALLEKVRMFKFYDLAKNLIPRLTDPHVGVRLKALEAATGTKNKDILKVLADIVSNDPSGDAKILAVRILVAAGENRFKRYLLLEKLKDKKVAVVLKAAKGLIEANDPKFGTSFVGLLLHTDARVREAGLQGLLHYQQFGPMAHALANPKLDKGIAERVGKILADKATGPQQAKGVSWLVTHGTKLGALHGAKVAGDKRVAGTTAALATALKRKEQRVRLAAARALSLLRDPAALEPLANVIRGLKDKDIKEREAMEGFAIKIVEAQTLDQAIKISKSVDVTVRQLAIKSLAAKVDKHKMKVVSTLNMRMNDSNVEIRRAAAYALARIKDDAVARGLLEKVNDSDPGVRAEIAFAVANSTLKAAPAILVKMMSDSHKLVKRAAVIGLRIKKVMGALPKLKMLSKIRYPAVRFEVWRAIASMSTKGDANDFDMWSTDCLYDKAPDIRVLAINMLSAYPADQRTAGAIGGAVIDTSVKVKVAALKALAVLKHANAGMEAARGLFDDDKEVKLAALTAIEKLKQAAVKGRLKEFLKKEKDPELRQKGKAVLATL